MLDSKETQISISAGLLHSLSEVNGYLVKLVRNMEPGENKDKFITTQQMLDVLEQLEIQTLKNWCKNNG